MRRAVLLALAVLAAACSGSDDDAAPATTSAPTTTAPATTTATGPATTAPAEPADPDELDWEPDILPFVEFVEAEMGVGFLEPVEVRRLDDAGYREAIASAQELTEEDREELDDITLAVRAFGILPPGSDLVAALEVVAGEGTAGFYRPEDGDLVVRGAELDTLVQLTVVHELVHALQDQHLDLEAIQDSDEVDGAAELVQILIEGEAEAVANRWAAAEPERAAEIAELAQAQAGSELDLDALREVPPALFRSFVSPYIVGPGLAEVLDPGPEGVWEVLRDPPVATRLILHPTDPGDDAAVPEAPPLPDGATELDRGDILGPLSALDLLARIVGPRQAAVIVDGWLGDQGVLYRRDDATACGATAMGFVDEGSATAAADALGEVDGFEVAHDGTDVTLTACLPDDADRYLDEESAASSAFVLAVLVVTSRTELAQLGLDDEQVECIGTTLIERYPEELLEADIDLLDPEDPGAQQLGPALLELQPALVGECL